MFTVIVFLFMGSCQYNNYPAPLGHVDFVCAAWLYTEAQGTFQSLKMFQRFGYLLKQKEIRLLKRNGFLLLVMQHLFVTDDSLSVVIAAFREIQIAFPMPGN